MSTENKNRLPVVREPQDPEKRKTCYSLSEAAWDILQQGANELRMSPAKLALICIKMYVHEEGVRMTDPDEGYFSSQIAVAYNPEPVVKKIKVELEAKEHHTLEMIRVLERTSVSFLVCIAIEKYIKKLVRVARKKALGTWRFFVRYLQRVACALQAIHFRVALNHRNIAQLSITICRFRGKHANPSKFQYRRGLRMNK